MRRARLDQALKLHKSTKISDYDSKMTCILARLLLPLRQGPGSSAVARSPPAHNLPFFPPRRWRLAGDINSNEHPKINLRRDLSFAIPVASAQRFVTIVYHKSAWYIRLTLYRHKCSLSPNCSRTPDCNSHLSPTTVTDSRNTPSKEEHL
jgi:hypothetical protein